MTIKSIQKVIKVGSSLAVTIPARDAKRLGVNAGTEVEISVKPLEDSPEHLRRTLDEYDAFKAQYGETLKNLSGR